MSDEKWLPVVGFEGLYEVSDLGQVRSLDREVPGRWGSTRRRASLLRASVDRRHCKGYRSVTLFRRGERTVRQVHHLVLEAFVGPCPAGMECCHGPLKYADGTPDNRLSNLRWDTHIANTADRKLHGSFQQPPPPPATGEAHPAAKLTWEIVRNFRARIAEGESKSALIKGYMSITGCARPLFYGIANGEYWKEPPVDC